MVATMVIEFSLAIYTLWRYKLDNLTRLVTLMLVGLATFQLAEYFVCTGADSAATAWSRLGFVAITALPPLGLHNVHVLAGKSERRLTSAVYAIMLGFMAFYLLAPEAFTGHQCTGNYVIFQFSKNVTGIYSVYYFGLLALGIGLAYRWANQLKTRVKQMQALQGMIYGYLVFLVPSGVAMSLNHRVLRGIPSVLCGFAVLLALILAFYILPRAAETKART
jgi:hypothetical protein